VARICEHFFDLWEGGKREGGKMVAGVNYKLAGYNGYVAADGGFTDIQFKLKRKQKLSLPHILFDSQGLTHDILRLKAAPLKSDFPGSM
jgi:hypothetical protein